MEVYYCYIENPEFTQGYLSVNVFGMRRKADEMRRSVAEKPSRRILRREGKVSAGLWLRRLFCSGRAIRCGRTKRARESGCFFVADIVGNNVGRGLFLLAFQNIVC